MKKATDKATENANANTDANTTTDATETATTAAATIADEGGNILDLLEELETLSSENAEGLTAKYKKFEKDVEVKAIFLGISDVEIKGETKKTAYFQTKEGTFLNANFILVNALERAPIGSPVSIKFIGTINTKGGEASNYDVRLLKPRTN